MTDLRDGSNVPRKKNRGGLPLRQAMLPLLFLTAAGAAQNVTQAMQGIDPAQVSYTGGQLKISAVNVSLADVLAKVTALTGVKIELPAGVDNARLPAIELGPGPAREVLASLLADSNFDYLIQASDTSPLKIQSVLVMKREKKGPGGNGVEALAHASRSSYASAAASSKPEEPPAPEPPSPVLAEVAAAAAALDPPPAVAETSASSALPQSHPDQLNSAKIAPLPPPPSLNQQSIGQQLQQMYGQRMLMNQQPAASTPAGK